MKNPIKYVGISFFSMCVAVNNCATPLPGSVDAVLLPSNASSADNLKLSLLLRCGSVFPYVADAYRVSMAQNKITVTLGAQQAGAIPGGCPPSPRDEIDLGRLPAGNYTITVIQQAFAGFPTSAVVDNAPFVITDGREVKVAHMCGSTTRGIGGIQKIPVGGYSSGTTRRTISLPRGLRTVQTVNQYGGSSSHVGTRLPRHFLHPSCKPVVLQVLPALRPRQPSMQMLEPQVWTSQTSVPAMRERLRTPSTAALNLSEVFRDLNLSR